MNMPDYDDWLMPLATMLAAAIVGVLVYVVLRPIARRISRAQSMDALSSQVAAAYHVAEQALVRADEQRSAALWEGLLRGRASDAAFLANQLAASDRLVEAN